MICLTTQRLTTTRPTSIHARRGIAALALVFVAACGGSDATGPGTSAAGEWRGSASNVSIDATLTDDNGSVNGTGTVSGAAGSLPITVAGTRTNAHVNLTVSSDGFSNFTFIGDLTSATKMQGTLNGSGFSNVAVTMTKQ